MTIPKEITDALKTVLFPELDKIKTEIAGVKGVISEQSQRLGDLNLHFIELERKMESTNARTDGLREDLSHKIDGTNARIDGLREDLSHKIDGTNTRIDGLREELNKRIDETNSRIDGLREELSHKLDENNMRMDRLYDVIVRREEHDKLDIRVIQLENKMQELSEKVAVLA